MSDEPNQTAPLLARKQDPAPDPLQEPRYLPWNDLVAVGRRWLRPKRKDERPVPVRPPWRVEDGKISTLPEFDEFRRDINATALAYGDYSPTPNLTNDAMGYGERVREELVRVTEGVAWKSQTRLRQRTKTGWQAITPPAAGNQSQEGER